jgi:excisionase family DNA binding protein
MHFMSDTVLVSPPDPSDLVIPDPYGRYLDTRELGKILGKSESSLYRLRKKKVIPFVLIGGEVRFRLAAVQKALERYTVKEVSL